MGGGASTGGGAKYEGATLRENLVRHFEIKRKKNGEVENDIAAKYDFDQAVLGEGVTGVVQAAKRKSDGASFAIKKIMLEPGSEPNRWYGKAKSKDPLVEDTLSEIKLLAETDHPNIARVYETYHESNVAFYLVMELCTGGELFDRLLSRKQGHLTEREAAYLSSQMFASIRYLHEKGIAHRDLKLENFIFATKPGQGEAKEDGSDLTTRLKLIDFGFSRKLHPHEVMRDTVGTSYYIAPEVIDHSSTASSDMWSLGVITYMLLSGNPPFGGNTDDDIMDKVRIGKYNFNKPVWKKVSTEAKDFIMKLLVMEPTQRLTAPQAFQHPWMKKEWAQHPVEPLSLDAFKQMQEFVQFSRMKQLAVETVAFAMNPQQIAALTKQFEGMDANHDGFVTRTEMKAALAKQGLVPKAQLDQITLFMNAMDETGDNKIELSEFVAATVDRRHYLDAKNLQAAFRQLDTDGNGTIQLDDLKRVLGETFDKERAKIFIKEAGGADGKVDYGEFMAMMKKNDTFNTSLTKKVTADEAAAAAEAKAE